MSLGHQSTRGDCDAFLAFLRANFLNKTPPSVGAPPRDVISGEQGGEMDLHGLIRTPLLVSTQEGAVRKVAANVAPSSGGDTPVTLAAIFVYPIKSCAGKFH